METSRQRKQKRLLSELTQGMELANQLKSHLDPSSQESCEFLLEKLLSSYDKALQMIELSVLFPEVRTAAAALALSQRGEGTGRDFNDHRNQNGRKKRKTLPRWIEQVHVGSGTGVDAPLDDGYNWRKYGQKDILGAKYPRAYYRCTHRTTQGCLAIKQVQKTDEKPSIFQVTYRGRHTCVQASDSVQQSRKESAAEKKEEVRKQEEKTFGPLGAVDRNVEDEELGISAGNMFPSFSFPSEQIQSEENDIGVMFSSPFLSPATSDSSYFSLPACQMNIGFEMNKSMHLQSPESGLTDLVMDPASLSVANSPIGDLDFGIGQSDFDPNLLFEIAEIHA